MNFFDKWTMGFLNIIILMSTLIYSDSIIRKLRCLNKTLGLWSIPFALCYYYHWQQLFFGESGKYYMVAPFDCSSNRLDKHLPAATISILVVPEVPIPVCRIVFTFAFDLAQEMTIDI